MASDTGPIKSLDDMHKWLESKRWILAGNPYNQFCLVAVLATAALTSKHIEQKTAMIATTFILDMDITDHILDTLADMVAYKAMAKVSGLIEKLGSTANFLAASNAKHAEVTLMLQSTASTLKRVSNLLGALVPNLASPPLRLHLGPHHQNSPSHCPIFPPLHLHLR